MFMTRSARGCDEMLSAIIVRATSGGCVVSAKGGRRGGSALRTPLSAHSSHRAGVGVLLWLLAKSLRPLAALLMYEQN